MLSRPHKMTFCLFCLALFLQSAPSMGEQKKLSRFAKDIYAWGRRFSQKLPTGWRMEWYPSQLSELSWLASPAEGYRIRFIHETRKVYIPAPIPEQNKHPMQWKALECSLHFYPKKGHYRAEWTRLSLHKPARIFAILRNTVVFQPDRFTAEEYPCPEILKTFRKYHPKVLSYRRIPISKYPKALKKQDIQDLLRFKNHAEIRFNAPWKKALWRNIAKRLGVRSIVLRYRTEDLERYEVIDTSKTR